VYSPAELRALTAVAHANDLLVHLDGPASNAAASLGLSFRNHQ
jgi:threonine aldolase